MLPTGWRELRAAGIPAGPIYNYAQAFADPQVQHLDMVQTVRRSDGSELPLLRGPVSVNGQAPAVRKAPPALGEDTLAVLAGLGLTAEQIAGLVAAGVVLDGAGPAAPAVDRPWLSCGMLSAHGEVAVLVIDNPAMRNAITHAMWQQFEALLAGLAADDAVKVVVVRGAGEHFSAGADIASVQEHPARPRHGAATAAGHHGCRGRAGRASPSPPSPRSTATAWAAAGRLPAPATSGWPADRAVFGVTPAKIGIVYPLSGIQRLVELAGPATAKYLLLSGDFVGAHEALRLGLATKVLAGTVLGSRSAPLRCAWPRARSSPTRRTRQLVNALGASPATSVAELSAYWQQEMVRSADAEIGIAAFLAKETPRFTWVGPAGG